MQGLCSSSDVNIPHYKLINWYFGIDLDDDDDEEDETETPSKHGEMRFGDAFRIKHKSTQHKFRK